jgi:hypothetical protein
MNINSTKPAISSASWRGVPTLLTRTVGISRMMRSATQSLFEREGSKTDSTRQG